jgi:hypothetical protein
MVYMVYGKRCALQLPVVLAIKDTPPPLMLSLIQAESHEHGTEAPPLFHGRLGWAGWFQQIDEESSRERGMPRTGLSPRDVGQLYLHVASLQGPQVAVHRFHPGTHV